MYKTFRCLTILALSEVTDSHLRMLFRGYSLGDKPGLLTRTPLEMFAYTVPAASLLYNLYRRFSNPDRSKNFNILNIRTDYGTHSTFYTIGI
jgi:hypothetical protein